MAQVTISIRGRGYQISCDDGQEAHLARLGRYLDQRASQLLENTGPVSDNLLIVMTALLVADELSDAAGELENLRRSGRGEAKIEAEEAIVQAIDQLASRIDSIAQRLDRS